MLQHRAKGLYKAGGIPVQVDGPALEHPRCVARCHPRLMWLRLQVAAGIHTPT